MGRFYCYSRVCMQNSTLDLQIEEFKVAVHKRILSGKIDAKKTEQPFKEATAVRNRTTPVMNENRLMRTFVCVLNALLCTILISCSSASSRQIYAEKSNLLKINSVAVLVESANLDVKYERETEISSGNYTFMGMAGIFGLIPFVIGSIAESISESTTDRNLAADVQRAVAEKKIKKILADYFFKNLKRANIFKITCFDDTSYRSFKIKEFDAIIELRIDDLSLRRVWNRERLNVSSNISGKMTNLRQDKVIWERHIAMLSDEEYTFDEFKAKGGKILLNEIDKIFRKIAFRLSSDIIYSD